MHDVPAKQWTWEVRDLGGKVLRQFTSHDSGTTYAAANWQWTHDYVYRDGQLLMAIVQPLDPTGNPAGNSVTEHFHLDHLGTPRLITDDAGVKLGFHTYYPFGAEQAPTSSESPTDAMKFTGHERDTLPADMHTLDYMHARYSSATLGRFLSVDSIVPTAAVHEPQRWSRYAYASNNPIKNTDSTGKLVEVRAGACDQRTGRCYSQRDAFLALQEMGGQRCR